MNRKALLLEPPYKNKYPPMGLMKLATYFRRYKDNVDLCEELDVKYTLSR